MCCILSRCCCWAQISLRSGRQESDSQRWAMSSCCCLLKCEQPCPTCSEQCCKTEWEKCEWQQNTIKGCKPNQPSRCIEEMFSVWWKHNHIAFKNCEESITGTQNTMEFFNTCSKNLCQKLIKKSQELISFQIQTGTDEQRKQSQVFRTQHVWQLPHQPQSCNANKTVVTKLGRPSAWWCKKKSEANWQNVGFEKLT